MLQQAGVLRMVYGFIKRVGEPTAKFEIDRRGAIAIAERRAAASDGRCQSCCTGGLVCTKVKQKSAMYIDNGIKAYLPY